MVQIKLLNHLSKFINTIVFILKYSNRNEFRSGELVQYVQDKTARTGCFETS